MHIEQKLISFRKALEKFGLTAFIIPSNDPHQSEYVAAHWQARQWISGFDGSAGIAIVTLDEAGLWTDSRYYLQAESQLAGTPVTFYPQTAELPNPHLHWLKERLKSGQKIGIDGRLLSEAGLEELKKFFAETGIEIITQYDPIAIAWENRPQLPNDLIFEHQLRFAGKSRGEKLTEIRAEMKKLGAKYHLLTTLDDIAWTFNLRGRDVECNPVFYANAIISENEAQLFVGIEKVDSNLKSKLEADGIEILPYSEIDDKLTKLDTSILLDRSLVSVSILDQIPSNVKRIAAANPSTLMKACKNETELALTRACMEKDGRALLKLMMWLEEIMPINPPTEYEVAMKLADFRAAEAHYFGESFAAIAGFAGNGAIVHYRPLPDKSATLKNEGVFLLDSGGQYEDGTTDITRTIALGQVSTKAIDAFTRVLQGHIALAMAKFPKGTRGIQLDILARQALWKAGLDFGHGTGHGVGFFLNVHEGPQGISNAPNPKSQFKLQPGMILSNEPGYYETGQFGIRIENLVLVKEIQPNQEGSFYEFETLSLFPIDQAMIDRKALTADEVDWLNDYHKMVFNRLSAQLSEIEKAWLAKKCAPILKN